MVASKSGTRTSQFMKSTMCIIVAVVLAIGLVPIVPSSAYADYSANLEYINMKIGSEEKPIDVSKNVATLDKQKKDTELVFTVKDKYSSLSAADKRREYVLLDEAGNPTTTLASVNGDEARFPIGKLLENHDLALRTSIKDSSGSGFKVEYQQRLNVRLVDGKQAETKPKSGDGANISEDGGTWSFSNGLSYTFNNSGFKFLDGTTMTLGALKLPLQYKHNPDGTTIVGINCSPEDKAFFDAIKNGNVWQKYSSEKMAEMTKKMDKGFSGKGIGKWGGKGFDWNICGFMEYNTKQPNAPRAVNLIVSMGLKAEGHAQYLIFTGTLTFTIGGKAILTGKWTPGSGFTGTFGMGVYAGLELYIGLGLDYIASVGGFGSGRIDVDFQILPETFLKQIMLKGTLGAKAKVFGFTVYTWNILSGEKPLYQRPADKKSAPALQAGGDEGGAQSGALNPDGTATSPFTVSADTAYPVDSRDYLQADSSLVTAQSDALTPQETQSSKTILKGIYGEAEPSCATTNDGPVVAYVADAAQVTEGDTREAVDRSALAYTRLKGGTWSSPAIIDTSSDNKEFADYSPSISTDGENCFVSWLSADSKIGEKASIGDVGKKLDVSVATIAKDDKIKVETVCEESSNDGTMPASPKAVKVGEDLYVGWYTNQTSGSSGEVLGMSGPHKARLFKRGSDGKWSEVASADMGAGAVTSFDVGVYGSTAACVWSLDEKLSEAKAVDVSLNGVASLGSSSVYALTPGGSASLVSANATNAQFVKQSGADVLTYAIEISPNDGESQPYLSIQSSSAPGASGQVVLNGANVDLPTPFYQIAGDIGVEKSGNVSFLGQYDGSSDVRALVTTGAGADYWTSIVEATNDNGAVTNYCSTYANGLPLFIYTTEPSTAEDGISPQAESDGSVDMNQSTEDSLKHLSVTDADFDEYVVKAGDKMPITVYFDNDGMLDVTGADLWMLKNGQATKVASDGNPVALDKEGSISFDYQIPAKSEFTAADKFTLYVAPAGVAVSAGTIERAKNEGSAIELTIGAPSLSLEVQHQIVDGQESIASTITNDGIVPQGAKLVYINSDTGEELGRVDVPVLEEAQTFSNTYAAANKYFQNDGVNNIIITLEDDGTQSEGYEINNTEFVSAWELHSDEERVTPQSTAAQTKAAPKATTTKSPRTGDQLDMGLVLALAVLAILVFAVMVYARKKQKS